MKSLLLVSSLCLVLSFACSKSQGVFSNFLDNINLPDCDTDENTCPQDYLCTFPKLKCVPKATSEKECPSGYTYDSCGFADPSCPYCHVCIEGCRPWWW